MNERAKELLSAYLDDGLSAVEAEELASLWGESPALAAQGSRYVQVGELLRMNAGVPAQPHATTLLARVQAALDTQALPTIEAADAEPGVGVTVGAAMATAEVHALASARRRWSRPVAGLALAAAVAMVALGGLRLLSSAPTVAPVPVAANPPDAAGSALLVADSNAPGAVMGLAQAAPFRWSVAEPEVEQRLNRYLVNHSEVTRSGTHGVLPYARVIGFRGPTAVSQQ